MTENVRKRSVGAVGRETGVERESTATSSDAGEKFVDAEKTIKCPQDAQFCIVWSTKMPPNSSLAAPQQSSREFSFLRIVSSTN